MSRLSTIRVRPKIMYVADGLRDVHVGRNCMKDELLRIPFFQNQNKLEEDLAVKGTIERTEMPVELL